MVKFLLFCILLVVCWPLALVALILYPLVWLLMIPFRLVGIAVGGVLELVRAIIFLPARLLRERLIRSAFSHGATPCLDVCFRVFGECVPPRSTSPPRMR